MKESSVLKYSTSRTQNAATNKVNFCAIGIDIWEETSKGAYTKQESNGATICSEEGGDPSCICSNNRVGMATHRKTSLCPILPLFKHKNEPFRLVARFHSSSILFYSAAQLVRRQW